MTDTPTGTGELIKRLRERAYFMCVSCNEAPYPEERQCYHAADLRLVDGEPWCEVCHEDSGAFPDVRWGDRPEFTPFIGLVEAVRAESADALEAAEASERRCEAKLSELAHKLKDMEDRAFAAERVIAPFAREADRYEPDEGDAHHDAWDSMFQIGHLRAARDWLARHATGQTGGDDE